MELVSEAGLNIRLENKMEIGRRVGFHSDDRTISRRHVVLALKEYEPDGDVRVAFEVVGKNPILVVRSGGTDKKVFRTSDKGELSVGDQLSPSLKKPVFVILKNVVSGEEEHERKRAQEAVERSKLGTLEGEDKGTADTLYGGVTGSEDVGVKSFDLSQIDPVKEFGFLVKGLEFNHYSKERIRDVRHWKWFIEESTGISEDDEGRSPEGRKHRKRKGKKIEDDEDEDWTGESEDDKASMAKLRNSKRPKYCNTRSREMKKPLKDNAKKSIEQKTMHDYNEEGEEEQQDEDT
ncbi:protein pxr1 [Aristolochia californica]|uniref:protein pxr1 n=1 Tax=Aristolochia californica TaxID=171875 RepID=UPI0035D65A06